MQETINVSETNAKTLEECISKISSNQVEQKQETHKQSELRSQHEKLRQKHDVISTDRFKVYKEIERVKAENEAKRGVIRRFEEIYGAELGQLTDVYTKKCEKFDKIMKKKLEKEVNIEEMDRDYENVSRFDLNGVD